MKLMILDGNSVINRSFYGVRLLSTKDGLYTNAVYGFITILLRLMEQEKPDALCTAFDLKGPTFRHERFKAYKAQRKGMPDELAVQNAQAAAELSEKQAKSEKLDAQIEKKTATVNAIMSYLPDLEKGNKVEDDCLAIRQELDSLLDGKLSIMKHSDEIISKAQRLSKIMKKLSNSTHKSGDTVYALRERLDKSLKETEDVRQRLKDKSGECSELRRDNSSLQAQVDELTEFVSLLKRCEPLKYSEVRQMQEHIHAQREQEAQQSSVRKKKSWGLE